MNPVSNKLKCNVIDVHLPEYIWEKSGLLHRNIVSSFKARTCASNSSLKSMKKIQTVNLAGQGSKHNNISYFNI